MNTALVELRIGETESGRVRRINGSPDVSWRDRMIRSPIVAIIGVFILLVAVAVYIGGTHEGAMTFGTLGAVALLVINSLNQHIRNSMTDKKIDDNTELTKKVPEKVAKESERVAEKLVVSTAKVLDEKIDAKGAEIAEVICKETSDTYQKAFKQGYEAGQLAMKREMEARNPPSF